MAPFVSESIHFLIWFPLSTQILGFLRRISKWILPSQKASILKCDYPVPPFFGFIQYGKFEHGFFTFQKRSCLNLTSLTHQFFWDFISEFRSGSFLLRQHPFWNLLTLIHSFFFGFPLRIQLWILSFGKHPSISIL